MKDRFADGFTTYPMPTGSYYSEQAKLHRALVRDERSLRHHRSSSGV